MLLTYYLYLKNIGEAFIKNNQSLNKIYMYISKINIHKYKSLYANCQKRM